jgi:hypothetical protein
MKNKIPDFIADRKEASKMRREIDKSIADLDQVDYLEKSGRLDAADKKRQEAIKNGLLWGTEMSKLISHVATSAIKDESDTKREHIKGGYGVTEAEIRARATMSGKGAGSDDKMFTNLLSKETAVATGLENLKRSNKSDYDKIRNEDALSKTPAGKKMVDDARERIKKAEQPFKDIQKDIDYAKSLNKKYYGSQEESNVDKSKRPPINSFQQ